MKPRRISRFEAAAQRLIEGSFSRILGGRVELSEIATKLGRALEDSHETGDTADLYIVHLHPDDAAVFEDRPETIERLVNYLVQLAKQTGISLPERPIVRLQANDTIALKHIQIEALYQDNTEQATQHYRPSQLTEVDAVAQAIRKLDAFLIVDGREHVELRKSLITLGRHEDNDIMLESPAVSRKHAQLRWRYGRFIIYDLGSRAGTLVNDQMITEYVLHPGDVITLANYTLIYGEGAATGERPRPQSSVLNGEETVARPGTTPLDRDVGHSNQGDV